MSVCHHRQYTFLTDVSVTLIALTSNSVVNCTGFFHDSLEEAIVHRNPYAMEQYVYIFTNIYTLLCNLHIFSTFLLPL
jgi:hypothetical protein